MFLHYVQEEKEKRKEQSNQIYLEEKEAPTEEVRNHWLCSLM
jgi:hypothetical protein